MHGHIWPRRRVSQLNRRHKPQFRNDQRAAVARAITGASILLGIPVKTSSQARAAQLVGSSIRYVQAACLVLQVEDPALLADVLAGRQPLLDVAAKICGRANLINAYRRAAPNDRAAFGSTVGANSVWNDVIIPSL